MTETDPAALSGLDLFRLSRDVPAAQRPPGIWSLTGMQIEEVEEGRIVFSLTPRPEFSNPLGQVHGGIHSTLLDSAMGCAVHTTLPAGVGYTTLELKVNFIRGIALDGPKLFGEGTVIHAGRRTATAEGAIRDAEGTLYAHATTTCMIFR
nr:PaaI family thioesterase [Kibdelosporangium sp. MJ126-NF4]CEL18216.1 hypothetical protein [Kibdelosporangium sp. MJ126-NF4]CTQ90553.1 hypothetical protein [Kibdelosporangium sp. MJ126-NF4]